MTNATQVARQSRRWRRTIQTDSTAAVSPHVIVEVRDDAILLATSTPKLSRLDGQAGRSLAAALSDASELVDRTHPRAVEGVVGGGGEKDPRPAVLRPGRWGHDGPDRYGTVPIMPTELHDGWCGWRRRTRDAQRPDLAFCAGCGLFVEVAR